MSETGKPVLDILSGKTPDRIPVWLMRQAGRYLPEYRQLRSKAEDFLNLALTPEWASEITLQPIRRFGFDAAIIFADILLVPMALGKKLEFREGEGPVLESVSNETDISKLNYDETKISAVFETVARVKNELPPQTALIGFCGSPWTVACYMIGGTSKNGFAEALHWAREKPETLQKLIDILIEFSVSYLAGQIGSGAEIIQLFDSWSGLLQGDLFTRWITAPTKKLASLLKAKYPHIPLIGFPREAGPHYRDYISNAGVDAVSIDQQVDLATARELQKIKPLQGNLDPSLLRKGGIDMKNASRAILEALGPRHIFNLGHGITPDVPPEHVAELVKLIRDWKQ